jgi:hypothetical protein
VCAGEGLCAHGRGQTYTTSLLDLVHGIRGLHAVAIHRHILVVKVAAAVLSHALVDQVLHVLELP